MENKSPKFSILISTKNRKDDLLFTLNKIQNLINNNQVECIVYDDGSSDGTHESVKNLFPQIKLLKNEVSKGYIYCRNFMLNTTKADYAISLDDDAHFVTENSLEIIEKYFTKNKKCGLIAFRLFWGRQLPESIQTNELPQRVKAFVGCGHVWRMKAWNEIPNYPEWFVFYGEEEFGSYNLLKKNWEIIYHPSVLVQHRVDFKTRKKDSDYQRRTRMSLRSGLYLFFLFLPFKTALRNIFYSLAMQIKNKVLKGDVLATLGFFQAVFDLLINIPRLILKRNGLTLNEYSIFTELPNAKIYWKPNES